MSTSLPISGMFPGLQYEATETLGVYHEDREVNGNLYRTYNATFNGTNWSTYAGSTAFALQQDDTGSIHFLKNPGTTTWSDSQWEGSGNNTVYNVADYGMIPTGLDTANAAALRSAIFDATNNGQGGGTIFIPSGEYKVAGPIQIGVTSPCQTVSLKIVGGSGHTQLTQTDESGGDFFLVDIDCGGDDDLGGVLFEDLIIKFKAGSTGGAAIKVGSVTGGQNVRLVRVVFSDCPISVAFLNTQQCGMLQCTITYTNSAVGNFTPLGVVIGSNTTSGELGKETYIAGCVFRSMGVNGSPPGPGGTGVMITNSEHVRMADTRIEGFEVGILISPGNATPPGGGPALKVHCVNVSIYTEASTLSPSGAALAITPQGSAMVQQADFIGCEFAPASGSVTAWTNGGVYINPGGGSIDEVRFISCFSCLWPGPGIEIVGGTNVEIIGGYYSNNGTGSGTTGAGIAVDGAASEVEITGAVCTNSFEGSPNTQDYGLFISNGAKNIYARSCNFHGNLTQAVSVSSPGGEIQVTDCTGYNDQGTPVSTTAPPSGTPFNGAYSGTGFTPYYGPIMCYCASAGATITAIDLNSSTSPLVGGAFMVAPGSTATATLHYGPPGHTPNFLAIGE